MGLKDKTQNVKRNIDPCYLHAQPLEHLNDKERRQYNCDSRKNKTGNVR